MAAWPGSHTQPLWQSSYSICCTYEPLALPFLHQFWPLWALSSHMLYSHWRVGTVPVDSSGRSTPVSLPKPQASSICCIFWVGAFADRTLLAFTLSDWYIW